MDSRSGVNTNWLNTKKHIFQNKQTFLRRLKILKPYLKPGLSILEIGCSSGFMLFPLIKKRYKCTGIEPSEFLINFKKKKIDVYSSLN